MSDNSQTLYDRFIKKIKNHKILSIIIIVGSSVIAIGAFSGAVRSIYDHWFAEEEPVEPTKQEVEQPPIEVKMRYYTFKGHSISMLLKGELTDKYKQILGGTPNVWQNDVYKELVNMENKFGTTSRVGDGVISFENPHENIPDKYLDFTVLPGTFKFYKDYLVDWDEFTQIAEKFPVNLTDGWAINFHRNPYIDYSDGDQISMYSNGKIHAQSISFTRIVNKEQALEYLKETYNKSQFQDYLLEKGYISDTERKKALEYFKEAGNNYHFYKYLTENGCPKDLFEAELTYEACGDFWTLDIDFPLMTLQALIIENVSGKPIKISDLKGKIRGGDKLVTLHPELEVKGDFEKTIGDGIFRQDELLIIPTNIIFTRQPAGQQEFEEYDHEVLDIDSIYTELNESLDKHGKYEVISSFFKDTTVYEIPKNTLASLLNNRSKKNPTEDYYYMSQTVDSFKVNGKKTKVYSVDEGSMFISHGSEAGSCPFIFDQDGYSMGNVLTGRITRDKEGLYSKVLPFAGSQFEIRELENEISYIKWVRMKCTSKEGEVWYLDSVNEILNPKNNEYIVLKKGERVEVKFDPQKIGYSNELEVYGYYELLPDFNTY